MRRHLFVTVLCGTLLPAPAPAQTSCRAAFSDSLARHELSAFERVAAAAPVWDDYRFGRHPLLLVADSTHRGTGATPVCAAIWRAGRPLEVVELPVRPRLSTPLYGMINLDPIGPGASEASRALAGSSRQTDTGVAEILRARGVTRVVVLPFPMDFNRLGALGAALRQARVDGAMMQADLAVHETFHLHAQFPTWLDQPRTYAWPSWDRQPDRRELRERCYGGSPSITVALRAEHAALVAAFDALDSAGAAGRSTVLEHARRFVALRAARRALLDTVSIALEGQRVRCGEAEDLMELEEGTTQWIGHATTVRAGLTTRAGKRGSYAQPQPEAFYQFGPLQLWVLDGLLGADAMRQLTTGLARAADPQRGGTVFGLFDEHTRRLSSER